MGNSKVQSSSQSEASQAPSTKFKVQSSKFKVQSSGPCYAWLRVTNYIQAWCEEQLGGGTLIHGHRLIYMWHLPGAKRVLREQVEDDAAMISRDPVSLSALRMDVLQAGLRLSRETMKERFGVSEADLENYVAVECPSLGLTKLGVLRPFGRHMAFSHLQAKRLHHILYTAFWKAVAEFDAAYAAEYPGEHYTAIEMVTAFCEEHSIPDMYAQLVRREWLRQRAKRGKS